MHSWVTNHQRSSSGFLLSESLHSRAISHRRSCFGIIFSQIVHSWPTNHKRSRTGILTVETLHSWATRGPINSVPAHWVDIHWITGLISTTGWDTLGLISDSCFILCHKCTSLHSCVGSIICLALACVKVTLTSLTHCSFHLLGYQPS